MPAEILTLDQYGSSYFYSTVATTKHSVQQQNIYYLRQLLHLRRKKQFTEQCRAMTSDKSLVGVNKPGT
jgi:hypothetical protein